MHLTLNFTINTENRDEVAEAIRVLQAIYGPAPKRWHIVGWKPDPSKIRAIKLYREIHPGSGIKESKGAVIDSGYDWKPYPPSCTPRQWEKFLGDMEAVGAIIEIE